MKPPYQHLYSQCKELHAKIYDYVQRVQPHVAKSADLTDLCDFAYALRESSKLLDDSRKELDRLQGLIANIVCAVYTAQTMNDETHKGEPIRTDHCTVTPTVKMSVPVPSPSKSPEEYKQLMAYLGLPHDAPVRPHWPSVTELVTRRLAAGAPLPDCVDPSAQTPIYSLTIRGNKDLLE